MSNYPSRRPFYKLYAWAYDYIIPPPSAAVCDFIAELFAERGAGPGSYVLDAGCGTGAYSVELARRGYRVTGIDMSAGLLEEARRRAGESKVAVKFYKCNLLYLPQWTPYHAILCRGVLNDILDADQRLLALASFARALRPGGVLVLDVREWEGTLRRKSADPFFMRRVETPRGRLTFRSVTRVDEKTRKLMVKERHMLDTDDVRYVTDYTFIMRCWTTEALRNGLSRAGFGAAEYFGAYDRSVPFGATDRMVCVTTLQPLSPRA